MLAGFEDILAFSGNTSARHDGEERDIFERLYAVRLDRLRDLPEFQELLKPLDDPRSPLRPPRRSRAIDDAGG